MDSRLGSPSDSFRRHHLQGVILWAECPNNRALTEGDPPGVAPDPDVINEGLEYKTLPSAGASLPPEERSLLAQNPIKV
jgi:hypothetical protein